MATVEVTLTFRIGVAETSSGEDAGNVDADAIAEAFRDELDTSTMTVTAEDADGREVEYELDPDVWGEYTACLVPERNL